MIAVEFILRNQIMIGMLGALFLFVSLRQRRKLFWLLMPCSAAAAVAFSALVPIPMPFNFLAYFAAIALVVALCFKGGWKQVLFSTTCAYCVQHMTSKIVYMLLMFWMQFQYAYVLYNGALLSLGLLLLSNALVCIPVYFVWTRRVIRSGALKFDNLKTIVYTAVFILCAVFLCGAGRSTRVSCAFAAFFCRRTVSGAFFRRAGGQERAKKQDGKEKNQVFSHFAFHSRLSPQFQNLMYVYHTRERRKFQ